MPPRRGAPSSNSTSPQDPSASTNLAAPSSPAFLGLPRSNSPSSGFTQFLSRPKAWFNRSSSAPRINAAVNEPKTTSNATGRKHKISHPTDPRPILDSYSAGASRSVHDLSIRPPGSLDISHDAPGSPSTPSVSSSGGLGDLRTISRRAWSKSADDLGKVSPAKFSPINTTFQNKVAEYRNRSDSSASGVSQPSPSSPISIMSARQPFPTIRSSSPPSSSPPGNSMPIQSSVSISISGPGEDDNPSSQNSTHVHTRSHSFTPRLSSKLAAPRFGPPSPKRKGSGSSEKESEVKEVEKPAPTSGTPTRAAFPFSFGGLGHRPSQPDFVSGNTASQTQIASRSTTLLSPPSIVEPDGDRANAKRSSQIIFHSGFINRLTEDPPWLQYPGAPAAQSLTLAKGWKPYKLELKGSKLYFYKPPGDRTAAIKELFPKEFVPADHDDEDGDAGGGAGGENWEGATRSRNGREREDTSFTTRKKRAFWGRRTHPDLVRSASGKIERGTFEACIHEAVFATCFFNAENLADGKDISKCREEWRDFASSILLCMPSLVGQAKFESEFLRCCAYLVSGAEEGTKEDDRSRVGWLAGEYLTYHGQPADATAWEEWRIETIPDASSAIIQTSVPAGMPKSSSMQALYVPSPAIGSMSPNIGMFSPRPEDGSKLLSLIDALGGQQPPSATPSSASGKSSMDFRMLDQQTLHPTYNQPNSPMPWTALAQEGLSRDVLLLLNPQLVARSLTFFHRSVLDQTPDNLTAQFVIGYETSNNDDTTSIASGFSQAASTFAPLFGSEDHPHWLTKLLLMQILGADTSSGKMSSPGPPSTNRNSEDRGPQTSRTHSRSEVISVWARVGELCRLAGDECSWRAILAALCSRPVARLDKAWKRVDPLALAAIESWIYPAGDGECIGVKEPKVTPWGGDMKTCIKSELSKARRDDGWIIEPLNKTRQMFEGFRTAFLLCPRKVNVVEGEIGEDVKRMVAYWRDMSAEGGGSGGLASKFVRVEQFMSLSLAAEPRRKGLFEPYHWSRSLSYAPHTSLLPLLFPEPLPTITLIDRGQLLRTRVDSDAPDLQFLRAIDAHMRPDERRILQLSETPGNRDVSSGLAGVGYGGTVIPVYNGDLLLVVQIGGDVASTSRPPSRAPSRPPSSVIDATVEKTVSRTPSIRVKPGSSQSLERKTSVARRSSLPSISHRQSFVVSEPSSERPLRVLVQAGTLSCLVSILVHGLQNVSVSVADDNGEMALSQGKTRELVVDHGELARVWWNVFRSFVTPLVFFELLRKLYVASQPQGSSPAVAEYLAVAKTRSEVLETVKEWLTSGGGAQDILDDVSLYNALQSFLESDTEHVVHESSKFQDSAVRQVWTALAESRKSLATLFIVRTMRPPARVLPVSRFSVNSTRMRPADNREPLDVDRADAEELVEYLDIMACATFSNVSEEDLFVTADLLEVQTADRIGWFLPREPSMMEDMVEIQTMYSHIQEVEPSHMISEMSQDAIYRLLPPGIRSCIRAYSILRKWLISKIVAHRLGLRTRQARIELFLRAIEVARLRNVDTEPSSLRLADRPCVRSFVEAVITSALLSVECRMHHRAFQNVALNRGTQCDNLASLLSRPFTQSTASKDSLTVDMGWLLERMLEVIATPDVVESSSVTEGQNLVNFDKRRHLCNLITNAPSLPSTRQSHQRDDVNRRGFERLNNIEKEIMPLQFDHRGIKEEAQREGLHAPVSGSASSKKLSRPFQRLVATQIEKNRRDKNLRSRLQKEKLHEQTRNDRREDMFNKAMRPRKPTTIPKQHRNKKSMSAFLQFMRPISSAFGADIPHVPEVRRTASELDFTPSGKPSLVLSLMDARVAHFINNERSFTFQLDTEDGGHYLLQAMNKRDMGKWIDVINQITKTAAKRRLTYLGNSPKPQLADHIHNQTATASRDPTAVFGVDLEFLLERENGTDSVEPGTIPSVMERCLLEVETRGLSEVGIYRIAGASSEITALKDAFNRGECPITESTDIHAVCDLVKSWFRVLPEPVFPSSSYHEIIDAMKLENLDARLAGIRSVVRGLPQANFDLLKRVSEHLDKVTDYEEHNQMTAEALAIVFSPNLLRAPQNDFVMILANMGHTHKLVKALITHFHVIFDDVDPETLDQDEDDDDYESAILEEDEDELDDDMSPRLTEEPQEYISTDYGDRSYTLS